MLSELEFNMKKIHIARNMGLAPKNNDDIGKQNNGTVWDTGEPSASGTCATVCSDKVASLPFDHLLNSHEGAFIPEYVKNFFQGMSRADKSGITAEGDQEFDTTEQNYNSLKLIAGAITNSTTRDDVFKLTADGEANLLMDPRGASERENSEESEINNLTSDATELNLLGIHHTQDEDISCGGERGKLVGICRVCGDHATGMYFGALVCVPCKTFFLRYAGDGNSFVCKADGNCKISTATRTQCKFCRYQKCMQAGMRRRVRPAQVKLNEGQQLCVVCSDVGNGVHFGALTCEGCKKFFRRGLSENGQYACKNGSNCVINPQTRNSCRYCRYQKCLQAGMCREAIQMGRPSKIPSNGGSRNSADRHPLLLRPVNRNADSSGKVDDAASFERVQTENLSQSLNLSRPENWFNTALFGQSFLNLKISRSLSLSSEESQFDAENASELVVQRQTSHPTLSNSDLAVQPDSTVLSPAETGHADEPDGPLNNQPASRILKTKGRTVPMSSESRPSLGRRMSANGNGTAEPLQEKRKRTSLAESEGGCSSGMPEMRLPSGDKAGVKSNLDQPFEAAKQQKINWALLGQGVLTSGVMLPFLKENRSSKTESQLQSRAECATASQGAVSCSSPSITSSLCSDTFHKEKHEEQLTDSVGNKRTKNEGSAIENSFSKRFDLESLVAKSRTYWLQPCLPDPNILFAGAKHWDVLNSIVPTYDRFLQMSNAINRTLKAEFEEWSRQVAEPMDNQTFLSEWIKHKVIPAYTIASVTYCKSLPGFSSFHCDDQRTIIRLGQSPSRILMAALNWYDADQKNFRNFLSWRDKKVGQLDLFKQKLIEYAEDITSLEVDAIEAALLNVLLILATDYPDLVRADVISDARWKILSTFRAYTTGKCGTPNSRVESLFSHMPELRRLGLLHHMMMTTRTMTAEEVEYLTSGRILDSKMVLSCQQSTDS